MLCWFCLYAAHSDSRLCLGIGSKEFGICLFTAVALCVCVCVCYLKTGAVELLRHHFVLFFESSLRAMFAGQTPVCNCYEVPEKMVVHPDIASQYPGQRGARMDWVPSK